MSIHELKYKKLLNELKFYNEELELIEEGIHDIHLGFEGYYKDFLEEKGTSKQELEDSSPKTKVYDALQERMEAAAGPAEADETGLVVLDEMSEEDQEAKKVFAKLYKDIVKKCHPDRLPTEDMEYFNKMNTRFKAATWGYNNAKWSIVIKVAQELGIKPSNYKKMNGHLRREVAAVQKKIKYHKSTFGWRLFEAEEKEAKDYIVNEFIYSLFRRRL
tara:strand:+ start:929 stop:1579 length:651 start_codon:yes stop_codon:yes gene_type:complete